jgi:hypothetical protein
MPPSANACRLLTQAVKNYGEELQHRNTVPSHKCQTEWPQSILLLILLSSPSYHYHHNHIITIINIIITIIILSCISIVEFSPLKN